VTDERLRELYHQLPTWFLQERIADLRRGAMGPVPPRYQKFIAAERADAARKILLLEAELARRGEGA
jgi:hypothetical protein